MFCNTNLSDNLGASEENFKTMNLLYAVFKTMNLLYAVFRSKVIHHNQVLGVKEP